MAAEHDPDSADSFLEEVARIDDTVAFPTLSPGANVGRFTIRGELGRGGMGVVYRAEDEQLGRSVALKMLRAGRASDAARRGRFLREARSAASLVHPNVAALYEIGEADGELFLAMELVEGEDLRRVLARAALAIPEAIRVGLGVARGIAAAHQRGIIHRDLKPENVMLDGEGEPKVLDFGLAKLTEGALAATPDQDHAEQGLTEEGLRLGTPGYMSPEQATGDAVDARSDVFSFGVVLFELVAGRRPFLGDSRSEALTALVRDAPPRLKTLRPEVPAALEQLVSACLEKSPSARPATMRVVVDSLAEMSATKAIARSSRAVRVLLPMVVVCLGILGGWSFLQAHPGVATSPVPEDAAAAVSTVRALTDAPAPSTKIPAAAAAYASALQNLRDASIALAQDDLERAVRLDPTFAAAHLRLLAPWWRGDSLGASREHYAASSRFRQTLDDRDRLLLAAAGAIVESPVDWSEAAIRLRALLARYPDDAEAQLWLAQVLINASDPGGARTVAERALVLDPELAIAPWVLAETYMFESVDQAQEQLDRCLAISPAGASCLRTRDNLFQEQGKCAEFEETARRIVAVEPKGPLAYLWLADALAVRAAPIESVRALLDKAAALGEAEMYAHAAGDRMVSDVGLALLVGDFPAAMAAARARDRAAVGDTAEAGHVGAAMTAITSLEEEGRSAEALAVAEEFERRSPAWVPNDATVRHYLLYARRHAGKIGDADFARGFAALEKEVLSERSKRVAPQVELILRTQFLEPSDLPLALPYLDHSTFYAHAEAWRGRALLLAGRAADAVAPLRAGAGVCSILPTEGEEDEWFGYQAFGFMRAHLWLGEALEATGDTAGACTAYRVVLDRWKNAKPRSVTLETARTHARALHCP